jgi:hypothetical protein
MSDKLVTAARAGVLARQLAVEAGHTVASCEVYCDTHTGGIEARMTDANGTNFNFSLASEWRSKTVEELRSYLVAVYPLAFAK